MKPLVIGHRGAKGHVAENTIASLLTAVELGADGVELDVHLSADGGIIVIHDETIDRVTGQKGRVSELTTSQLRQLRIGGVYSIPTLADVIDALPKNLIINIELKTGMAARPVVHLLGNLGSDLGRFIISSFDWVALKEVRACNPKIPIGVLTETDLELAVGFASSIGAETLHPHFVLLHDGNVGLAKSSGLKIFPWTVNEPEDLERLTRMGVAGIITDFPDRLKAIFAHAAL